MHTMTSSWATAIFRHFDMMACLACVIFFLIWPQFDLSFSRYFYDETSQSFSWGDHFVAQFIYQLTNVIAGILVVGLPSLLAASYVFRNKLLSQNRKVLLFMFCTCVLGPGVMVNSVLKDHWDRPRPVQSIEFGGDNAFEPPFSPQFACGGDCHSFVSGHASIGFVFFGLALLHRNRKWVLVPVALGAIIGMTRIVQGGHFFSDVVFSGWVVWFSSLLVHYLFYGRDKSSVSD
jgi:lipid A 4'-phosphatase